MCALFWIKVLTLWEFLNRLVTIFEDRRPEIPSAKDFLGCIHPRKMTTTCSRVAVIENMFSLFMGEASSKNGIYTTPVQCIIQDKVVFHVVMDTVTIIMRYIGIKSLCLEIND